MKFRLVVLGAGDEGRDDLIDDFSRDLVSVEWALRMILEVLASVPNWHELHGSVRRSMIFLMKGIGRAGFSM